MNGFVVFVLMALASAAAAQNAQILSDARYLSNNGQFGSAYTQGDGVEFKEEADAEGNRRGSYSYVDPNGQRRTVSYTAGKDGFKATGDHLPVAPTPVPVPAVPAVPSVPSAAPSARWQDQWSQQPAAPQWNQWNSAPAPAVASAKNDDGQWRAEYDDAGKYDDGQWNQWSSGSSGDVGSQKWNQWNTATAAPAVPMAKQAWNQWNSIPTTGKWSQWSTAAPPASYNVNQASGKFNLNRSPDGFSYTYSQN